MRRKLIGLTASLLLISGSVSAQESVLISNAQLVIGDGSVNENGSLLFEDGVISAVGNGAIDAPDGVRVIDGSGKTVVPALIDGHTHLGYQGTRDWGGHNYTSETLRDNLEQYAWYGFAAAFSAGSDPDEMAQEFQRIQGEAYPDAARLLFGAGMAPEGQGPNDTFLVEVVAVEERTGQTILRGLTSPEQAVLRAREVADRGISFIKIWVDDRGGSQAKLAPELYRPLIAESERLGIKVFVHHQFPEDMPDQLEAGVAGFLHGRLGDALTDEIAQQTAAAGAFVIPNLGLGELRREAIGDDPFLRAVMPAEAANALAGPDSGRQASVTRDAGREASLSASLARLLDAGVDIVLGTDAGPLPGHPFGYSGHRELEIYVRLGMTPMQALVAATSAAARHLDLDDLGLLAPGYSASLVILSASPLEDIRNTRSIEQVFLAGREIDRGAIASRLTE
ncbi:MAG: amidohydrolase family protein [Gammaproteobacteria bacterium]|nr:amidohydrolase family protein [Gammaproteobacteria bacterium]